MLTHSKGFAYIPDRTDFLDLFPHRGSYLWATHPQPGQRPEWQTETAHVLSDRLIRQGSHLYGVRFGKVTHYLMIDIDIDSRYHPTRDPYALSRIVDALEPIGLNHYLAVSSSYSGGIHLYFPFYQGQPSWAIANAAATLLESAGIIPAAGQIEIFPNARRYSTSLSDFNGHRLPLQNGSYLLDRDWNPTFTTHDRFIERWTFAENQNSVTREAIDLVLKQFERRRWAFIKQKALKFLNDLNAEIEPGWTGPGQTNYLLGRIAMREYIFYHVLHNTERPLSGIPLQMRILEIALSLPGFKQWSKHQRDLPKLVTYWARSVEQSPNYYPYGGSCIAPTSASTALSVNEQRRLEARQRIQTAVQELQIAGEFPQGIRARIYALKAKGIGSNTLYRNKDLWHGETSEFNPFQSPEPASDGVILAIADETEQSRSPEPASDGVILAIGTISFICDLDCPPNGADPDEHTEKPGGSGGNSTAASGIEHVKAALAAIRHQKQVLKNLTTLPPDQHWFEQLRLGQLVPAELAGQGKDPTRIQLPLTGGPEYD